MGEQREGLCSVGGHGVGVILSLHHIVPTSPKVVYLQQTWLDAREGPGSDHTLQEC